LIPFVLPFLVKLSEKTDNQILPLTTVCGLFLFTIVIDRFAKRIVVERSEKWLNLLKATPLPATLYIGAKLTAISLICGVFTVTYFTLITFIAHIEVVNNLSTLIVVLIIGIIPFGLLGITLGFLLEPKSADSILGYSLLLIPLLCWLLPIPIPDKFSWIKDLLVILPFYYYRTLVESIINNGNDSLIFLNILWLIWATFLFYYLAVLSYQREKVIQK